MRRYDIVSGILLILSTVDFALAAPVLVQEKRQACVDVVHIPRDVITVLGKRGGEELENLAEEYLKALAKPAESSDAHASSGSVQPGPYRGSTNVMHVPGPNPASSTANPKIPNPLIEPPSSAPPAGPDHGSANVAQAPAPNPASSTANLNPLMESSSSLSTASSDSEDYGWLFEPEVGDELYRPLPKSVAYPPSTITETGSPTEPGHKVVHLPFMFTEWENHPTYKSVHLPFMFTEWENHPTYVVHEPRPSPKLTDPEDHQSLSTDSQPADPQAAIYVAKGKAKESRRISGTTGDVRNVAQRPPRELQPDERSLDPGE